ncbi:MAG: hypothetical protein AB1540_10640 [Bdellovibrionota bacterium]
MNLRRTLASCALLGVLAIATSCTDQTNREMDNNNAAPTQNRSGEMREDDANRQPQSAPRDDANDLNQDGAGNSGSNSVPSESTGQ